MGTLIGLVFCALLVSGKIMTAESSMYSSPDIAVRFSRCLMEKVNELKLLTPKDQNGMIGVHNVMSQTLLTKKQTLLSTKILIIEFLTTLTDLVIQEDVLKNNYRKRNYFSALEQCSLSSTGHIDVEFIKEAKGIFSVIERDKGLIYTGIRPVGMPPTGNFGAASHPPISGVGNTFVGQPSPVQNAPFPQHFLTNVKTDFQQHQRPQFPAIASSAQAAANAQHTIQSSTQTALSSGFGTGVQGQLGNPPHMFHISDISQTNLNIPQTKESTVVVIPPNTNKQLTQNQHHPVEEGMRRPSNPENVPKLKISEFSKGSSVAVPQAQYSHSDVASYQEQENIIFNILMNAVKFRETFNSKISQTNAISLARELTEQTFSGYDFTIMKDALSVVTIEVAKVRVPCPENFALALSKALVYVLKQHEKVLSTKQSQLATNFLSNLDNSRKFYPQQEAVKKQTPDYNTGQAPGQFHPQPETIEKLPQNYNTGQTQEQFYKQPETIEKQSQDYNRGQTPGKIHPQPETTEIESQDYKTGQTPETFYTQPETIEKQSQDYHAGETPEQSDSQPEFIEKLYQDYYTDETVYSDIDEKKTDFDFQSPPLSPEDRKDEMFSLSLARCLSNSEPIRNFFCDENEPEDKVQISFSIIKVSLTEYGPHVGPLAASIASGALSELSKEELCNKYAKTISETVAEILEESKIDDANAENIAGKMELNLIQRLIAPTESQTPPSMSEDLPSGISKTETDSNAPKLESSFTSVEESNPHHQEETEHPHLIIAPDTEDVPDYEYTYHTALSDESVGSSAEQPVISLEDWAPDGVVDQGALADYLTERFSILETYDSNVSGEEFTNAGEETSFTVEAGENQKSGKKLAKEFRRKHRRGRKRKKIAASQSDTVTTSSDLYEEDKEDYYPTTTTSEDEIFDQQDESEIVQEDKKPSTSTVSNVKTSPVELQPSFQDPAIHFEDTDMEYQQNSEKVPPGNTDPTTVFARQVSERAESTITYIRSRNFDLNNLCTQINQLAPIVNIPILDHCEPIAAIDYLLNVLRSVVKKLSGV